MPDVIAVSQTLQTTDVKSSASRPKKLALALASMAMASASVSRHYGLGLV